MVTLRNMRQALHGTVTYYNSNCFCQQCSHDATLHGTGTSLLQVHLRRKHATLPISWRGYLTPVTLQSLGSCSDLHPTVDISPAGP